MELTLKEQPGEMAIAELANGDSAELRNAKVAELLELCRTHPSLISEKIYFRGKYMTLLHLFVVKGVNLESIRTACDLAPNVKELLNTRDEDYDRKLGEYPLNAACRLATEDVIVFLAQQSPNLLTKRGRTDELAIHWVMLLARIPERKVSFSTVKTLLELTPMWPGFDRTMDLALKLSYPLDILDLIVSRKKSGGIDISEEMTFNQAKIVCKMFPKLRTISLQGEWKSHSTLLYVMKQLLRSKKIVEIRHLTLPPLIGLRQEQQKEATDALQVFVQQCTTLSLLRLQFSDQCTSSCEEVWGKAILAGLSKTPTVKNVEVRPKSDFYSVAPAFMPETKNICLNLLADNPTIWFCYPWGYFDPEIKYYLDLNRFGRSEARNATGGQMYAILICLALSQCVWEGTSGDHSTAYGLLRETPASWSNGESSPPPPLSPPRTRKRKYSSTKAGIAFRKKIIEKGAHLFT